MFLFVCYIVKLFNVNEQAFIDYSLESNHIVSYQILFIFDLYLLYLITYFKDINKKHFTETLSNLYYV